MKTLLEQVRNLLGMLFRVIGSVAWYVFFVPFFLVAGMRVLLTKDKIEIFFYVAYTIDVGGQRVALHEQPFREHSMFSAARQVRSAWARGDYYGGEMPPEEEVQVVVVEYDDAAGDHPTGFENTITVSGSPDRDFAHVFYVAYRVLDDGQRVALARDAAFFRWHRSSMPAGRARALSGFVDRDYDFGERAESPDGLDAWRAPNMDHAAESCRIGWTKGAYHGCEKPPEEEVQIVVVEIDGDNREPTGSEVTMALPPAAAILIFPKHSRMRKIAEAAAAGERE